MGTGLFDLQGRVAIVTGSSRGLGRQMATALATAGADLVLTSRRSGSLVECEASIRKMGCRVLSLELDVQSLESITRMVAAAGDFRPHRYPRQQCRLQYPQTGG